MDLDSASDVAFCLDAIIAKHGITPIKEAMKRKFPVVVCKPNLHWTTCKPSVSEKIVESRQQKTCSFCLDRYDSVHICSRMNPSLYNWWTHELAELQLSAEMPNKCDSWGGLWRSIDADVNSYGVAYLRKTETLGLIVVPYGMGADYRKQLDQKNLIEIKGVSDAELERRKAFCNSVGPSYSCLKCGKSIGCVGMCGDCHPTGLLTDELREDDVLSKIVKHENPSPEKQGTWRDRPSML